MTRHDSGRYKLKHADQPTVDPLIFRAVSEKISDGGITCAGAHKIAIALSISPSKVGKSLDLMEKRIRKCQLGFFGYQPERRIIKPAPQVSPALADVLKAASSAGRVTCLRVWEIADRFSISRLEAAAACEALDLKVAACQLGAF